MPTQHRGLFDAHLHVIDPRFPLVPNRGYLPNPFTAEDYMERAAPLGVVGGAVVSGSSQAFDQTYLLDALERLGPSFVGVTQLPGSVSDEQILRLHAARVRAVRFNFYRGGSEAWRAWNVSRSASTTSLDGTLNCTWTQRIFRIWSLVSLRCRRL